MTATVGVGIGLAFIAMLSWGFGDFLIQKSTRKMGDWETLFLITLFGAVVLLPFVWHSLPRLVSGDMEMLGVLFMAGIILFLAALLDFEALREGKLAVIEPIWSLEVPTAAILALFIVNEHITAVQTLLIIFLVLCLILVAFRGKKLSASLFMEKGVIVAIGGAIFMGAANFFMGWGGRVSDPLLVNFFTDVFIVCVTAIYLIANNKFYRSFRDLKHNYQILLPMCVSDKAAWVAFVFAMTLAPIAIATAFSESYIIIAVIFGLFINKEKLRSHQKAGLFGAILTAAVLAFITSS